MATRLEYCFGFCHLVHMVHLGSLRHHFGHHLGQVRCLAIDAFKAIDDSSRHSVLLDCFLGETVGLGIGLEIDIR